VSKVPARVAGPKVQPHRARTSSPPPTHPIKRRLVYWLADNFNDPAFDSGLWNLNGHGSGADATEADGQLEFSIGSDVAFDSSVNAVDEHYGTNCYLTGDFDARVDFKLLTWPQADGVLVSFGIYLPPPNETFWSISRKGGTASDDTEGYLTWINDRGNWASTDDQSGSLRIRRTSGYVAAYYRANGAWTKVGGGEVPGPASLVLMLAAHPGQFGALPAEAAVDNFQATATSVSCPLGTPIPPRRRLR
jgi:hypothetical protein